MAKEVVLVDPLALGEATNGGGTQAEEAALRKIDATEMEVVSVSSDEPPNVVKVAQSSRAEGPSTLVRVGCDPHRWGSPCLTWSDRNQPGAPPVFVLDNVEEQGDWEWLQGGCKTFNNALSLALLALQNVIHPTARYVEPGRSLSFAFFPL
jgi:hypothetical protein